MDILRAENEILKILSSIEKRIEEKVERKVDTVISDIGALSARIDKIDNQHKETNERVIKTEANLNNLEKYVEKLERENKESHDSLKKDSEKQAETKAEKSELRAKIFVYGLMGMAAMALIKVLAG